MNNLKRLFVEEEGQAMTEYGILVGLIAVVVIAAIAALGTTLLGFFEDINSELGGTGGGN